MKARGKPTERTAKAVTKRKVGPTHVDDSGRDWEEKREREKLKEALSARMIEFLDLSNIPERGRVGVVANVTHRRPQGVAKWFKSAGVLPDTMSIYLFARTFQASADYLLGLTPRMRVAKGQVENERNSDNESAAPARSHADNSFAVASVISERLDGNTCITMDGDEMEPTIKRNAPVWIDASIGGIQGNGLYAIEFKGRKTVRAVEDRPGEGISLICDNKRYREQTIGPRDGLERRGITVIGKVVGWLQTA